MKRSCHKAMIRTDIKRIATHLVARSLHLWICKYELISLTSLSKTKNKKTRNGIAQLYNYHLLCRGGLGLPFSLAACFKKCCTFTSLLLTHQASDAQLECQRLRTAIFHFLYNAYKVSQLFVNSLVSLLKYKCSLLLSLYPYQETKRSRDDFFP